jgi:hypothetical protein
MFPAPLCVLLGKSGAFVAALCFCRFQAVGGIAAFGRTSGRYRIISQTGKGGMQEISQA